MRKRIARGWRNFKCSWNRGLSKLRFNVDCTHQMEINMPEATNMN